MDELVLGKLYAHFNNILTISMQNTNLNKFRWTIFFSDNFQLCAYTLILQPFSKFT